MRANRDASKPRNMVATCKVMVPTEVETAAGSKPGGAEEFKGQLLFLPWNFLFVSLSLSLLDSSL